MPPPAPPAPAPAVTCDPSAVADGLTREIITSGIEPVRADAEQCGTRRPSMRGVVKVHVNVGADGVVTQAAALQTPDPGLGECVASAMRKSVFACTRQGGSFTYPFVF